MEMARTQKKKTPKLTSSIKRYAAAFFFAGLLLSAYGCAKKHIKAAPTDSTPVSARTASNQESKPEIGSPEPLTKELIAELPDDLLEQGVASWVEYKLSKISGDEENAVKQLPKPLRMIYTTINVESEIDTGGWNQYFWNTRMKLNHEALEDFGIIGADDYVALMKRAVAIGEKEEVWRERYRRLGTPEAFDESFKYTKLGPLDDEFDKLKASKPLTKYRASYIRAHADEYVMK